MLETYKKYLNEIQSVYETELQDWLYDKFGRSDKYNMDEVMKSVSEKVESITSIDVNIKDAEDCRIIVQYNGNKGKIEKTSSWIIIGGDLNILNNFDMIKDNLDSYLIDEKRNLGNGYYKFVDTIRYWQNVSGAKYFPHVVFNFILTSLLAKIAYDKK